MSVTDNPIALLKALLPKVPLILKTILLHSLHLSAGAGKQDLRTELTVTIIRSFVDASVPVGKQQRASMRAPPVRGPMWISKVTLPAPPAEEGDGANDVLVALIKAVNELKTDGSETFEVPPIQPVEAEWTGYRSGVSNKEPPLDIPEEEKYKRLKAESTADMAILYIHGGALYLMDPATHRAPVTQLSKLTGAPVLSVRYRLAPQHPFPAGLLDVLVAYLSLISPPPGSLHEAIPANKIVLSGDSAGGNLSLALLQTLLTLKRISPTVRFHGKDIPIELPAGLCLSSPWTDVTRSMPSVHGNAKYDYLAPPRKIPLDSLYTPPRFPDDDVWPRSPPRIDMYCDANIVGHPLVSPLATPQHLWKASPPVYMSVGEEGLTDEGLITARRIQQADRAHNRVIVDQYEGMPHCFGLMMLGTTASRHSLRLMAQFCRDVTGVPAPAAAVDKSKETTANTNTNANGAAGEQSSIESRAGFSTFWKYGLRSSIKIPLDDVHSLTDAEADKLILDAVKRRTEGERVLVENWREKAKL